MLVKVVAGERNLAGVRVCLFVIMGIGFTVTAPAKR